MKTNLKKHSYCSYVENYKYSFGIYQPEGITMGKLNVVVKDEVDTKFREEVFKRKGMKKGNITKSLEEAMLLWISVDDGRKIHKANK